MLRSRLRRGGVVRLGMLGGSVVSLSLPPLPLGPSLTRRLAARLSVDDKFDLVRSIGEECIQVRGKPGSE